MQLFSSPVPARHIPPGTLVLFLVASLVACGSDSPTDNGNGDPVSVQAVAASIFGIETVASGGFVAPDDEGIEVGATGSLGPFMRRASGRRHAARLAAAIGRSEGCPAGGTIVTTEEAQNVGSPYADMVQVERVVADDCMHEQDVAYTDGIFEYGLAEPAGGGLYAVTYFKSSGLDGDPDSGSYAISDLHIPEVGLQLRYEIRALGHSCLGCSNPEHGGTFEQRWFMESFWTSHESDLSWRVGESTGQPYHIVIVEDAANDRMEVTANGRLGVSQTDNPCSFDAHHETVSPIIPGGASSDEPELLAGVLDIADRDGAWSHRVEFDDGEVFIDGERVRPEDIDECTFEFSAT